MSLAITFGTNLRHHRKLKGLTQAALADQASLSTEMISKIERGVASPSFANVEKLSEILEIPEFALFGGGIVLIEGGERTRVLSKIQNKISRLSNEQLARVDRLLVAFMDYDKL